MLQDAVCGSQGGPLASNLFHDSHPQADTFACCAVTGKVLFEYYKTAGLADNVQVYVHKMCLHKGNIWISDLKKLKVHLLDFFPELSTASHSLHQQMAFDCLSISKTNKKLSMYVGFETKTYNI